MQTHECFGLTSPVNLRRVKLKPTPVTPETNAGQATTSSFPPNSTSPAGSTPDTPRFARIRQRSTFERNGESGGMNMKDDVSNTVNVVPTAGQALSRPTTTTPKVAKDEKLEKEQAVRNTTQRDANANLCSDCKPVIPVTDSVNASCASCIELKIQCVSKDTQIAHLTLQLTRLRGCLVAIETLAEKQASHESSSEHDLQKLERKLRLYREALRATGLSPESSCPVSPWGSLGALGEVGTEMGTLGMGVPRRIPSRDELGLHKVHGGTRFEPRAGTGMETRAGIHDDETDETDESKMRE